MRRAVAFVLAWALPVAAAAQAPPTNPPTGTSGPMTGGSTRPAPGGTDIPLPGTLHRFWLQEGDHLRFWEAGRQLVAEEGTLVGSDVRTISVVRHGSAEAIQYVALQRLEVQRGHHHWWKGAWIGALTAAVLYTASGEPFDEDVDWEDRVVDGVIVTASGAAVGALFGGLVYHPHWETVDLSSVKDIPPRKDLQSRMAPELARPVAGGVPMVHVTLRF